MAWFDLRSGDLQWLVTAYLLMSGGGLLLGGRIADLLSRRLVFLTGLTVFTSASIFNGFAGNAARDWPMWGPVGSMGFAAGVLVGGALTTWAGGQAIFWINGRIGAVALLAAFKIVPNATTAHAGLKQPHPNRG